MKLKKFFLPAILFAATFWACSDATIVDSDNGDFYHNDDENCSCINKNDIVYTSKPPKAEVTIRVSTNKENPDVTISVYEGSMSEGSVKKTIKTSTNRITDSLETFVTYTYVAKYKKGNDSIIVPVHAKLYAEGHECNGYYCYEIINNVIDLSLKF